MIRKSAAGDASEPAWFKSSYSDGPDGDSCVEIAVASDAIHVRDSKDAVGPHLALKAKVWADFVTYASRS
ncbi:DUF397 domain-containing protein [Streptomyces coeruleorubidus]|uniref:DUF397 domain-containing protein n=1 Tax=Streptomyces coeruleorubidus TaxID=116188 RepID=UPI003663F227